jgi:Fic family protein
MVTYNWQQSDWPNFTYSLEGLDEGPKGFEGGMNARKYINITKTSKSTATRDMQHLMEIGAFKRLGKAGGRSTRYQVNL